jgi:hypothetical protein
VSIELYEHVRALMEDVKGLNKRVSDLEALIRMGHDNVALQSSPVICKKPGPKPKQPST